MLFADSLCLVKRHTDRAELVAGPLPVVPFHVCLLLAEGDGFNVTAYRDIGAVARRQY